MTDDAIEPPPRLQMDIEEQRAATLEHRVGVLEARCSILEKACRVAFGKAWMEQVMDDVGRDMNQPKVANDDK